MTGPDDSHSDTRPISVAELLARNGTIGPPPVGGRRRRRRGNSDSVTVAELTGEIPIIREHDADADAEREPTVDAVGHSDAAGPVPPSGAGGVDGAEPQAETQPAPAADEYEDVDDEYADA